MPNDDIRDLLGRYATGALSEDERRRLSEAALDDQELFDQLAREQDLKQLLDEPGARDRMIRALRPPARRKAWIFGFAATAALSAVLVVFLLRPVPKPQEVAVLKTPPAATTIAPPETASSAPVREAPVREAAVPSAAVDKKEVTASQPGANGVPAPVQVKTAIEEPRFEARLKDAENKVEVQKERDQAAAALIPPSAPPALRKKSELARSASAQSQLTGGEQQQGIAGGPKQNAQQRVAVTAASSSVAMDERTIPFGFHYSVETKGHLIVVPGADGYLSVKSSEGAVLFARKRSAAGIVVDIALPDGANSVSIVFSESASPVQTTPVVRTSPEGNVQGPTAVAIDLKIK